MKIVYKCMVCNEAFEHGSCCPQCESEELFTVYRCEVCKKTWFWRSSEKECCHKIKEEKRKNG